MIKPINTPEGNDWQIDSLAIAQDKLDEMHEEIESSRLRIKELEKVVSAVKKLTLERGCSSWEDDLIDALEALQPPQQQQKDL